MKIHFFSTNRLVFQNQPEQEPLPRLPKMEQGPGNKINVEATEEAAQQALKAILDRTGVHYDKLEPERQKALVKLVQTAGIHSKEEWAQHPMLLTFVDDQLTRWGYKPDKTAEKIARPESERDHVGNEINDSLKGGIVPTQKYKSKVHYFGEKVTPYTEGKLEHKINNGPFDPEIRAVEAFLLELDDKRQLRRKAHNVNEVYENVESLGLTKYFQMDGGKLIENADDLKTGAMLDDVLRSQKDSQFLHQVDPLEAIKASAAMITEVHRHVVQHGKGGGIGELTGNNVVLQLDNNAKITGARLTMLTSVYIDKGDKLCLTQRATDLNDLIFCIGSAGIERGGEEAAKTYIETFLKNYKNNAVKDQARELLKSGIPAKTLHNITRYGFDHVNDKDKNFGRVREIALQILENIEPFDNPFEKN